MFHWSKSTWKGQLFAQDYTGQCARGGGSKRTARLLGCGDVGVGVVAPGEEHVLHDNITHVPITSSHVTSLRYVASSGIAPCRDIAHHVVSCHTMLMLDFLQVALGLGARVGARGEVHLLAGLPQRCTRRGGMCATSLNGLYVVFVVSNCILCGLFIRRFT